MTRKEIIERIPDCDKDTPVEKLKDICESEEDLNEALTACLHFIENDFVDDAEIPSKWKEVALQELKNAPNEKITCALIQKKFGVSYHLAWRLKDWLLKVK